MATKKKTKKTVDPEMVVARAQIKASEQASRAGWYLVRSPSGHLFAVNPDCSAEVWTWYAQDMIWRRKGEKSTKVLHSPVPADARAND